MQQRQYEQAPDQRTHCQKEWLIEGCSDDESLYELVAKQMHSYGFPDVTGAAVDAVHRRQQGRVKILHPVNQLIAWHLWWRLEHGDEELPA